jgi:hypothetical protein
MRDAPKTDVSLKENILNAEKRSDESHTILFNTCSSLFVIYETERSVILCT